MQHFKINPEGYQDPEPTHNYFSIGTRITFRNVGGQLKSAIHIPVQFA